MIVIHTIQYASAGRGQEIKVYVNINGGEEKRRRKTSIDASVIIKKTIKN